MSSTDDQLLDTRATLRPADASWQATKWIFPADSADGHLVEQKEDRETLSKWGNELRQTFRTVATPAGVSELDARMLMNHSIPGVNAGYITRHKLLEDHLRRQQQAISSTIFGTLGDTIAQEMKVAAWLGPGATRRTISLAREEFMRREVTAVMARRRTA